MSKFKSLDALADEVHVGPMLLVEFRHDNRGGVLHLNARNWARWACGPAVVVSLCPCCIIRAKPEGKLCPQLRSGWHRSACPSTQSAFRRTALISPPSAI